MTVFSAQDKYGDTIQVADHGEEVCIQTGDKYEGGCVDLNADQLEGLIAALQKRVDAMRVRNATQTAQLTAALRGDR